MLFSSLPFPSILSQSVDNETTDLLSAETTNQPPRENELAAAELAHNKQRHVTNLMEDAMLESRVGRLSGAGDGHGDGEEEEEEEDEEDTEFGDEGFLRTGTEVFFFPGEGSRPPPRPLDDRLMGVSVCLETLEGTEFDETLPQVEEDLGAIPSSSHSLPSARAPERRTPQAVVNKQQATAAVNTSDADEDYCIIGDEEKVAFVSVLKRRFRLAGFYIMISVFFLCL